MREGDVKKAKRHLRAFARSKGVDPGSERGRAIVYGRLRRMGWRPSRENMTLGKAKRVMGKK
jgi:hypothetical protein